jgi:Domain of unknown function (DUF5667)
MTPPDLERQNAEKFAQLVDSRDPLPDQRGSPADIASLAAMGRRLSSVPIAVAVDPTFRAHFRAELVAAAEREQVARAAGQREASPAPVRPVVRLSAGLAKARALFDSTPQTRRVRTRGAIIAAVAAGAIAVSGISTASEDSVPGDALYGMKRSTERAQLAMAGDDLSRAELLLGFAWTRAGEAQAVRGDAAAVDRLLTDTDRETTVAVSLLTRTAVERTSPAPLDVISSFLDRQREPLDELRAGTDKSTANRAATSVRLLDNVARRVGELRAALACGTADAGSEDDLGPIPADCPS